MWNWQLPKWPYFQYDSAPLKALEQAFLKAQGGEIAIMKHLDGAKGKDFIIDILCLEGMNSAEIEGEILRRESLQASIQRHFGIQGESTQISASEQGMGDLMWEVYSSFNEPLSHEMLMHWHSLMLGHVSSSLEVGKYRSHSDPMQIVSGRYDQHKVYFEAPPSSLVFREMTQFIDWYNEEAITRSPLEKASIVHLYFESIHPFEDGNGRIGRALVEKVLSQAMGKPTLTAVSQIIKMNKREYYAELGRCNRTLDVQGWVVYFSNVILKAQEMALSWLHFLIAKSKFMHQLKGKINLRQEKVLLRLFAEGIKGFDGGLSAENYISITKTSRATATRDLADLVRKKALYKVGELKHSRYWLNLPKDE